MHEDLDKILIETIKYRKQFGKIEIITNGTLFPNEKLKAVLEKYAVEDGCITLLVDHYGELSKKYMSLDYILLRRVLITRYGFITEKMLIVEDGLILVIFQKNYFQYLR